MKRPPFTAPSGIARCCWWACAGTALHGCSMQHHRDPSNCCLPVGAVLCVVQPERDQLVARQAPYLPWPDTEFCSLHYPLNDLLLCSLLPGRICACIAVSRWVISYQCMALAALGYLTAHCSQRYSQHRTLV